MNARPHSPLAGTIAGGIAMLGTLVTLRLLTVFTGLRPLAEILADGILLLMPVEMFSWIKSNLGDQAKTWLYIGIMLGFLLLGMGLGRWLSAGGDRWLIRTWQAASALFVLAVSLVYLVDRAQLRDSFLPTILPLAVAAFVFAWITYALLQLPFGSDSPSRRKAIGAIVAGIGAVVLGRDVLTLWQHQAESSVDQAENETTPAITPNDQFYRISKNFTDPMHTSGPNWKMKISGQVAQEGWWNVEQLQAIGIKHSISTMLCISNEVGGNLIGTAEWTGLPLAVLLDEVGAEGNFVWFTGLDGYETSVPMERCRHPQAFIVWGMNGEPLPNEHGAPVRAIIPGLYGMKSVKWLTGFEVIDDDRLGFWEQRNWTNTAAVKPMSRIDFPRRTSNLSAGMIPVRGVAFGGDAGVSRVEVSTDGGSTWHEARITEQPNPDGIAWSLWQWDWAADPGTHHLVVRSVGLDGTVQTSETASPIPDGSGGWHTVDVFINRL